MPHQSFFSYNIQRPYPYIWFTPVVFVGGALALALFSALNFILTGYSLTVEYSSNPNTTIQDEQLFPRLPSILTSKTQPSCQPLDIPVATTFFTNQSGLTYTLTGVGRRTPGAPAISSLTYMNNVFQNCSVTGVQINLDSIDRTAAQIGWKEWGAELRGFISCYADTADGHTPVNLTTTYDYVPTTVTFPTFVDGSSTLFSFISRNQTSRASLYWGESIMSMYQGYLTMLMEDIRIKSSVVPPKKGSIYFVANRDGNHEIKSLDYHSVDYRFIRDDANGSLQVWYPRDYDLENATIAQLAAVRAYPNLWSVADTLVKAFSSTILTDLGQVNTLMTGQNILTDKALLTYFTSNFTEALKWQRNAMPGPAILNYAVLGNTTGPLGTTPSVIETKYLCQIPRQKSVGAIIYSVVLADLIVLQTLWFLLKLIVETFVMRESRKGPEIHYCNGCVDRKESNEETSTVVEVEEDLEGVIYRDPKQPPTVEEQPVRGEAEWNRDYRRISHT